MPAEDRPNAAAYKPGISGPHGTLGAGGTPTPGGRAGPGGTEGPVGGAGVDGDVEDAGSACAVPIPSPTALKPRPPATAAMATNCLSFSRHFICVGLWCPLRLRAAPRRGRRLSDQKLPTKLAQLSVIGARVALGLFASLDEVVDASLVGNGIGYVDTGIVGVCLCWWDAEGCQCHGCCRRHAHYCPLHRLFLF
jgi:hypothetical protein